MINYLERALRQNRAEEEEEQETGNRLLSETRGRETETEGRFLLSQRTEEPSLLSPEEPSLFGIPGPSGAIRPTAAPAPDALTRALSRAAETDPLEVPPAQGTEQSARREPVGAVTLLSGQEARPQSPLPGLTPEPQRGFALTLGTDQAPLGPASSPVDSSQPLLTALRRSDFAADFVQRERRTFTVTLPEIPDPAPGLTAQGLDRAVERDARRYDGGFSLY